MKKERHPLSASMKIADLVDFNFNLLGVLTRLGIGFGFGDETVEEVCRRTGINANTFLLICNVYSFDGYRPSSDVLREIDLRDIVRYLRRSHAFYMDVAVKSLAAAKQTHDRLEQLYHPAVDFSALDRFTMEHISEYINSSI